MAQAELLEELKKLSLKERLAVIEEGLHQVREDFQRMEHPLAQKEKQQLAVAAKELLPDYATGGELTAFTVLDSEDFHAEG